MLQKRIFCLRPYGQPSFPQPAQVLVHGLRVEAGETTAGCRGHFAEVDPIAHVVEIDTDEVQAGSQRLGGLQQQFQIRRLAHGAVKPVELHASTGVAPVAVVKRTAVIRESGPVNLNELHLAVEGEEFVVHGSGPGPIVDKFLDHDSGSDRPILTFAGSIVVVGCQPTTTGVEQLIDVQCCLIEDYANPP